MAADAARLTSRCGGGSDRRQKWCREHVGADAAGAASGRAAPAGCAHGEDQCNLCGAWHPRKQCTNRCIPNLPASRRLLRAVYMVCFAH